jgi:transketolase N-terminal domain/subunit
LSTANDQLAVTGRRVREHVLRESRRANVGHIGSALSVADLTLFYAYEAERT